MDVRLKIEGKEYHLQHMPLKQKYEAEKALGMNMTDNETSSVMVMLFVAMRQEDPERPAVEIADEIGNSDLFSLESVESPLDEEDAGQNGKDPSHLPPSGLQDSDLSESLSTSTI